VTGAMGMPVAEQRPGDCYMWGACEANPGAAGSRPAAGAAPGACAWQHSEVPVLVSDTHHLDVAEVAPVTDPLPSTQSCERTAEGFPCLPEP
jgi:hypothetical protein